jgi:hypothetical protein
LRKEIGLLINFGPTGFKVKRKYRKPVLESWGVFRRRRIEFFQFHQETGKKMILIIL